jgi:hypothetical protein
MGLDLSLPLRIVIGSKMLRHSERGLVLALGFMAGDEAGMQPGLAIGHAKVGRPDATFKTSLAMPCTKAHRPVCTLS